MIGGALVWVPAPSSLAIQGAWIKAVVLAGILLDGHRQYRQRAASAAGRSRHQDVGSPGPVFNPRRHRVFGAIGFIVGPIVAAIFVTIWEIFGTAYREDLEVEPPPHIQLPR